MSRRHGRGTVLALLLTADVILTLVLVELARPPALPKGVGATAPASATAGPTAGSTASSVAGSIAGQSAGPGEPVVPGMAQEPVKFHVEVTPASVRNPATSDDALRRTLAAVRDNLAARGLTGRRAGFVEVFAAGPEHATGQAVATAQTVLRYLREQVPMFGKAGGDGYWGGAGDDLEFKIFFYN